MRAANFNLVYGNAHSHSVILSSMCPKISLSARASIRMIGRALTQRASVSRPLERPRKSWPLFLTDSRTPVAFENASAACTSVTERTMI